MFQALHAQAAFTPIQIVSSSNNQLRILSKSKHVLYAVDYKLHYY